MFTSIEMDHPMALRSARQILPPAVEKAILPHMQNMKHSTNTSLCESSNSSKTERFGGLPLSYDQRNSRPIFHFFYLFFFLPQSQV